MIGPKQVTKGQKCLTCQEIFRPGQTAGSSANLTASSEINETLILMEDIAL